MTSFPLHPTPETWLHILFGDDNGGGHLAGQGIEGKTEFPESWNISRIESAILSAQTNALARGIPVGISQFDELVDGLILRVVFARTVNGRPALKTAHPLRGNGVFRIINGERVSKPLLRQDRRK